MKRSLFFLTMIIAFSSCTTTRVKVNSVYPNGARIDSLNLISTIIGPLSQPDFPLIDAALFNERTNTISNDIMDEEQKRINDYRLILVQNLQDKLPSKIRTGLDFNSDISKKYKVNNVLQIDNKNFPIVFFSEGDMNVVDFGKGKDVNAIFKNNEILKHRITSLAIELELQTVLISYNRLSVVSAGMFGTSGNLRLESYLFLYKANGDLIMDAYGFTKPTIISGKQLLEYKMQLDYFQELAQLMSKELVKFIK